MATRIDKVTAFITRSRGATHELLLFEHPYAGIEIPAGTVEPGEAPQAAALRETREETGLVDVTLQAHITTQTGDLPDGKRVIVQAAPAYARPDPTSWNWITLPRGLWVDALRHTGGYTQIAYTEPEHMRTPDVITFAITAWVPDHVLGHGWRRHFFHLTHQGNTPDRWTVTTDGHRFTLFWAPLADLPPVVPPQGAWIPVLREHLAQGKRR